MSYPSLNLGRPHTPPHRATHGFPMNAALARGGRGSGTWTPLTNVGPFGSNGAGTAILMTDGTVFVNDNTSNWYRLTPDQSGSYVNGTWTTGPGLPSGYGPLYFASAILPDGRLIVEGGEYNFFNPTETTLGAIYDPVANSWSSVSPPSGWSKIGDAQSVVLTNGTMMLGNCCGQNQALLDATNLTWSTTGTGKADGNSEEGWTLLPDGTVLTADVGNEPNSERYNPQTGSWSSAGTIPVDLVQAFEMGPAVLRPDGTVFQAGASGHNAVYTTASGKWTAAPDFPMVGGQQLDVADGPASLLPDGNVLISASPGAYNAPDYWFEWDGKNINSVAATPDSPGDSSYAIRTLILPTGQVLETNFTPDVFVYTPKGKPMRSLKPKISSVPSTLVHGTTYTISGTKFNGASQDNMYGDDAQMATNYPLVRITNGGTGHVFFARTHNFSSMAVASSATVSASFDVPSGIETGASKLEVVTNGIASKPVSVTVQ